MGTDTRTASLNINNEIVNCFRVGVGWFAVTIITLDFHLLYVAYMYTPEISKSVKTTQFAIDIGNV